MSVARVERLSPTPAPASNLLKVLWMRLRADVAQAADWVRRTHCALGGHDLLLRFEPTRISLYCPSCGHNTPGWTVRSA